MAKMNNMEIKQGDKVMVSKDAPKVYMSSMNNLFKYHVCKVEEVDGDSAIIRYTDIGIGIDRWLAIPTKYLVKVDAEAKEPTEEKKSGSIIEEIVNKLSDMSEAHGNATETIKDKSYWDAYAADLAKEIALKVANKFNAPEQAAEYAVKVAKAVVEGLKRE